jgi:hypothetical protein
MWVIIAFEPVEYRYAFGSLGPLLFVMCFGIYAGVDRTLWRRLSPVLVALAYGSAVIAAYYTVRLSVHGYISGNNPMNQHVQTALWLSLAALVIRRSSEWKRHVFALIPIAMCIPISILMGSRGWTVLSILAFLFGVKWAFLGHFRSNPVLTIVLASSAVTISAAGLWLLTSVLPERVDAFQDRLDDDTRSSQYTQFFQQVDVLSLIPGLGPKATYTFGEWSDYNWIDNQFLFISFKFGLPILLAYCAVVLWPGLRLLFKSNRSQGRRMVVFFVLWTLATLGVSTFHGITNNPQNFVTVLLAGRSFISMRRWRIVRSTQVASISVGRMAT